VSPGALVLAAAIPILFLHVAYQPGFGVAFGSTTIDAYLSDFAVLAVVIAAIVRGIRDGFQPLARGRFLWAAGALFFAWTLLEVVNGHLHASGYEWRVHGVTAAKFAEYALLAPAVPLLLRTASDILAPLWALAVWSACATAVGIAQFFGADIFFPGAFARRQASFLSSADFAALSGAALLVGLVALAMPKLRLGRALGRAATASGALGMIVAGAMASVLGLATALVALAVVLLRRREVDLRRVATVGACRPGRRRRRRCDPRQGPRRVRALRRRVVRAAGAADEGADLRTPDAPRLDRLPDLDRPPTARRRLGGLDGPGELRALPARCPPPLSR